MKKIKIVIVGAGFGGIYILKNLYKIFGKNKNVEITLVNDKNYFLFTPLLHEIATGSIDPQNTIEPIRKVWGCRLNSLCLSEALEVRVEEKVIVTTSSNIEYDHLILALGSETNFYNIPGAREKSFTLKSLEDAILIKNYCIDMVEKASHIKDLDKRKDTLRFVIVGGGPTGVELATEMQEFLKETFSKFYPKDIVNSISIVLIHRGEDLLLQFPLSLRKKSLEVLKKKGIDVRLNLSVSKIDDDQIWLSNGEVIRLGKVIWVAGVKPKNINFSLEVDRDENGRLEANQYLQLKRFENIFVLGDMASLKLDNGNPLPNLAQVAVEEAKTLALNIKRQIEGKKLIPFSYKSKGSLVSLGKWMAVGEIFELVLWGRLTWFLWRTVYLFKLISWQKKVKVAIDWTINAFSPRDISRF